MYVLLSQDTYLSESVFINMTDKYSHMMHDSRKYASHW